MKKKMFVMFFAIFVCLLSGCTLKNYFSLFPVPLYYQELPKTEFRVYVDLEKENWEITPYNSSNLTKYNGKIYYKDFFRLYEVGSTSGKEIYRVTSGGEMKTVNGKTYIECVYDDDDRYFPYSTIENGQVVGVENIEEGYYFSNRTKYSFFGISSIIIHKYEDKTYHLSMKEDGQTKILEEKNETTGEVRLIKKISELTNKIIIYRDKKHIVVIEHMCEGEFDNNNCTNVKASIYNVDTLESSALEQLLFHADYDEILIHYEIKYHGSEIYVFYKTDEYFQVKIFNVETNEVKWEKFEFEFCDYEYINHGICHSNYSEYDDYLNGILTSIEYTSINIFDDKYYYIVEPHKVSRIDRKSGTIELVYEVVQKYRFLF